MKIGVDANQGWRVTVVADAPLWDLARARRFADACADAGVAWLEEPLPMDAYDDLAALTDVEPRADRRGRAATAVACRSCR